jgi:hypothetical protein
VGTCRALMCMFNVLGLCNWNLLSFRLLPWRSWVIFCGRGLNRHGPYTPPPPPELTPSLGVGMVGGVKAISAALLALVLGVQPQPI